MLDFENTAELNLNSQDTLQYKKTVLNLEFKVRMQRSRHQLFATGAGGGGGGNERRRYYVESRAVSIFYGNTEN